ncbi:cytochrome P450 [Parafrankia sp. EAN1pec]|uniref:cytochrome P450 n=1 Tax=Parafrankia sp. (strain EAN1pec) TaxID=298653 RepID=UPI00005451C6|nr:cytochrome P450 [Frankia sp. EAN1pec]
MSVTETVPQDQDQDLPSFPFPDTFSPLPSGTLAEIARRAPAIRVRFGPGQIPIWLIVRHSPARAMLSDPRFSRTKTLEFRPPLTGAQIPDPNSLLWLDPPDHTRIRRLVSTGFAHRRIEQLRPWVAETARRHVTAMTAKDAPADLRAALAAALPVDVICQILGVPEIDRENVRTWSETLFRFATNREAAAAGQKALYGYMDSLVRERQAQLAAGEPVTKLFDVLITTQDTDDGRLNEVELRSLALTLLIGGFETTAGVITNAVTTLLTDRSQWESLVGNPALLPNAVEELLRYHPLSMTFPRVATEDVDLGEFTVRAGEVAIAPFAATNRDPDLYDDPDRLDLTREPVANLAFGHGAHHCIGAHLARVELTEVLSALIDIVPTLRLAVPVSELRYELAAPIGRPEKLPVAW